MAYIDADALLENLKKQYGEDLGWQCTVNMSDVGMMIEDAPTADVVEVVRCSTCERCKILADEFDNDWYFCMRDYDVEVSANHFCGYGKRKPNLSTIPTGLERSSDNEQSI